MIDTFACPPDVTLRMIARLELAGDELAKEARRDGDHHVAAAAMRWTQAKLANEKESAKHERIFDLHLSDLAADVEAERREAS
jgi:hypothetical protein